MEINDFRNVERTKSEMGVTERVKSDNKLVDPQGTMTQKHTGGKQSMMLDAPAPADAEEEEDNYSDDDESP